LLALLERFLALANRLNRLVGEAKGTEPLLVHFIPITREEGRDWSEVLNGLQEVETSLAAWDLPDQRRQFFTDVITAMTMQCREGMGESIPYGQRVATYLGVPGEPVGEDLIAAMERALAALLAAAGHKGSLPAALQSWRAANRLAPEEFASRAGAMIADARRETHARIAALPDGTAAEFEPVRNVFYNGYSKATGLYRSRVMLNADLGWTTPALAHVVAHESFPGHSALNAIRQRHGLDGTLPPEAGLYFSNTPITPIIEGTCNLGMRLLGWCRTIDDEITDLEKRYRAGLSTNWVYRLHANGWSGERLVAEMMDRRGIPRIEAETHLRFLADPLWCTGIPHYYYGTEAVRDVFLRFEAAGRRAEFCDILYREVHTMGTFRRRVGTA